MQGRNPGEERVCPAGSLAGLVLPPTAASFCIGSRFRFARSMWSGLLAPLLLYPSLHDAMDTMPGAVPRDAKQR